MTTGIDAPQAPPPPPPPPRKSGCWKWGAIGCLILLILGAIGVAVLAFGVFAALKATDAYKEALRRAQSDPRVIAAIGTPIEPSFVVMGNVSVDGSGGQADMTFNVSGPRGKAKVHAVATRDPNGWTFSTMTATPRNGTTIDLLNPPSP